MEDEDPYDYYDEYCEWLMEQLEIQICNGRQLVERFEQGWGFERFLEERKIK